MEFMDKIILVLGFVVLIMAIAALGIYSTYQKSEDQVMTFADSGRNLEDINLIGERGLMAVTDATVAKIDAANAEKEEEKQEEVEDNTVTTIVVNMTFTSIQKDLKIKFTNKRTGKLIAGIPFEVKAVAPSGKESVWTDDDKDGIIIFYYYYGTLYYYSNVMDEGLVVVVNELINSCYE
jgi:hypothetical protein